MARSAKALVEPSVLAWARKTAGLTEEEAARRLRVDAARILGWEKEGPDGPTVKQLQQLANIYKRPMSVLYLPEPPLDFQPLRDFRRLPGIEGTTTSPVLVYELRRAQEMRQIAIELLEMASEPLPQIKAQASLQDDPEAVGQQIRDLLRVTTRAIDSWSSPYDPFNRWRAAIEEAGALVFQASGIPLSVMRAFSIAEQPVPVIVANTQDTPNGRVFSLLHEFTHLLLREGGVCDLGEDNRPPEERGIEIFCNAVAGAALLPRQVLLSDPIVVAKGTSKEWSDRELQDLARRHRVSREVVLRRLLRFERTTLAFYQERRERFLEEYAERREKGSGFAPPSTMAVATLGKPFAKLVLQNYYRERISLSTVSDYLGVRLKHLAKVEAKIWQSG